MKIITFFQGMFFKISAECVFESLSQLVRPFVTREKFDIFSVEVVSSLHNLIVRSEIHCIC
jgi:hypothetical protein